MDPVHLKSSVFVSALLEPLDEHTEWASARFRLSSKGVWTLFGPSIVQFEEISSVDPTAEVLGEIPLFHAHYEKRSRSKILRHYTGLVVLTPITVVLDICTLPLQAWWQEHVDNESDDR